MKDKRLFDQYVEHLDKTIEFESMVNGFIERLNEEIKKLKEQNNCLQSENAEQKAEIERLTKTLDVCSEQLYHSCMDKGELQKQVDELTEERENMQAEIIATEESRLKTVKDTAKEIYDELKNEVISVDIPRGRKPAEEDCEAVLLWKIEKILRKKAQVK